MRLFTSLHYRLPPTQDLLLVFGGVAFVVHLWALFNLFYILPGWILRLDLGELTGSVAYVLVFSLLESLLVWALLALATIVLPQRWLGQQAIAPGMSLFVLTTLFAVIFQFSYARLATEPALLVVAAALFLALAVVLLLFIRRFTWLETGWRKILQMTIVPTAFYVFLDILALLVICYRNIF